MVPFNLTVVLQKKFSFEENKLIRDVTSKGRRGEYTKRIDSDKAMIGKGASEHGFN